MKMLKSIDFNLLQLISKFRTELMGYAILGVLIAHLLMYSGHPIRFVDFVCRLVYTQGFLFLSGFGLYYSYSKDGRIRSFYIKRINRLYIPFVLISFIFLAASCFAKGESIVDFIAYLTTIAFWYKGNYFGMWYVAVSLLLYALYPYLHRFLFYKSNGIIIRCALIIILLSISFILLSRYDPEKWKLLEKWVIKIPMFPIGMIAGYYTKQKFEFTYVKLFVYGVLMLILIPVTKSFNHYCYEMIRVLIGIPLICFCFIFIERRIKVLVWILKSLRWLGKYSLEIYLLHLFLYRMILFTTSIHEMLSIILSIIITLLLCKPIHVTIDKWQQSKYYFIR